MIHAVPITFRLPSRAVRCRTSAWMGLFAVAVTLLMGSFGDLPLPGPDDTTPFTLVICTADGLMRLDDMGGGDGGQHYDFCLMCLPLFLGSVVGLAVVLLVLLAVVMSRSVMVPPAEIDTEPSYGFGTVRDARGPPLCIA